MIKSIVMRKCATYDDAEFLNKGNMISYKYSFLEPVGVYMGVNCSEEHEKILREISRKLQFKEVVKFDIMSFK